MTQRVKRLCFSILFLICIGILYQSEIKIVYCSELKAYVENEIIITYNQNLSKIELEALLNQLPYPYTLKECVGQYALLSVPQESPLFYMIAQLESIAEIELAQPNYHLTASTLTNDTYSSTQWALDNEGSYNIFSGNLTSVRKATKGIDLNIRKAWEAYPLSKKDTREVVVAIIDTGVDYMHPDLKDSIWINEKEIPQDGIDNDGNKFIDDVYGWDFYNNDNTICHYYYNKKEGNYLSSRTDSDDHGTHCAGIIASIGNNFVGIAGIASNVNVKIMPIKALGGSRGKEPGSGTTFDVIKAIKYATRMNADICNLSCGISNYNKAFKRAIAESDMLFIAAAGNSGSNNSNSPIYPASFQLDNLISVTSIDANGNLSKFGNYGIDSVDIAAPGEDIYSTIVGSYSSLSGSSMAAPHIAGIAAMLYSSNNHLYASNVKQMILENITPLPGLSGYIKAPGIPDTYKLIQNLSSLQTDIYPPEIHCTTSYRKSDIIIFPHISDKGNSTLRTTKYLVGKKKIKDFARGNNGIIIQGNSFDLQKGGYYTIYASDYAGNETAFVYYVEEDCTSRSIKVSNSSS